MRHEPLPTPNQRPADTSRIAGPSCTADTIRNLWRAGEPPDLAALLQQQPELNDHPSLIVPLAHEEYVKRLRAGEQLDAAEFARRFAPALEQKIFTKCMVDSILVGNQEAAVPQDVVVWPEPKTHFLGFNLIREIGRGAFGRVFEATEQALGGRPVVLKVVVQGWQEAEKLARLRHPNIVPVHSVCQEDMTGLAAICMPYLGQATLSVVRDALFAHGRVPLQARAIWEAIQAANADHEATEPVAPPRILLAGSYVEGVIYLAAEMAEGLAHAHDCGLCHRDLKPSNILLSPSARPLLLDFDLAVDEQRPVAVGGTLPYMAPEELNRLGGEPAGIRSRPYDPSSDVFSLGVVVYELLTGTLPFGPVFHDDSVRESVRALQPRQAQGPPPIRRRNPQVDPRLAGLIESCLALKAEDRPKGAAELAAALRRELSFPWRLRRWTATHRWRVATAAALLAASLLAGTVALALRPPYAVRQFRSGLEYLEQGRDDLAIQCLSASLEADPARPETLLARARAYEHQGDYWTAFHDYSAAAELAPSPSVDAHMGYCMGRLGDHEVACARYLSAVKAGCDSPAVLNDLASSLICLCKFDDAEGYLRRAIERDDRLQPAYYNLATVLFQRALKNGQQPPPEALAAATRAADLGPQSGELCYDIADMQMLAAQGDPAMVRSALENVRKAIALGIDPDRFRSDPIFQDLREDPRFQKALSEPRTAVTAVKPECLVAP